MNDQPIIPEAMSTLNSTENNVVATPTVVAATEPLSFWRSQQAPYALSAVLAVLLAMHWYSSNTQIHSLRDEMARRLQLSDVSAIEVKGIAKTMQETSRDLQTKVTLLEGKQAEAQGQQLALEQLYQDLSKNRDEWALAEIEQVLATASQQLQLAGNVQGALIALQNADNRLAKSEKAQFIAVRRAIAKDIEMLKTLPQLDMTGLVLRLDSVITQVDSIPLWSDEKPPAIVTAPKAPLRVLPKPSKGKSEKDNEASGENTFSAKVQDYWQSFSSEMWTEVKQLVRVRNIENPEALLLTPSQAYFARENLKLRLLNARLALLSRNEGAFRSDMISAQDIITKYFDVRSKQAQTAQSLLKQVQSNNLSIEMPALTESLNSVRNFKVKP